MDTLLPAIGHPVVFVDRAVRSTDSRIGRALFCSVVQVLSAIDQNAVRNHQNRHTVTAKDIVFAFYSLGFIGRRELQHSLENIASEEQRLFAHRAGQAQGETATATAAET